MKENKKNLRDTKIALVVVTNKRRDFLYIHLYSPNYGSMNEKIYTYVEKISNKNTETELNNIQTPRLFA